MNRAERRAAAANGKAHSTRRKIWLAVPCYGANVMVLTMKSIIHDMFHLIGRGDEVRLFDEIGHADIYLLRAQIVERFLNDKDATDLVMIDSDVGWPGMGLVRLVDHGVDMVAGAYPRRDYPITFMMRSDVEQQFTGDAETGLMEMLGMPAGLMCIKRHVLEQMTAHYAEELECHHFIDGAMRPLVRLFDPYWYKDNEGHRQVLGEDYSFCQRWRDMGGKVHMDANLPMAHVGTHAFQGCIGKSLAIKQEQAA